MRWLAWAAIAQPGLPIIAGVDVSRGALYRHLGHVGEGAEPYSRALVTAKSEQSRTGSGRENARGSTSVAVAGCCSVFGCGAPGCNQAPVILGADIGLIG